MENSEVREYAEQERERLLHLAVEEGLTVTRWDFKGHAPDSLTVQLSAKDFRLLLERAAQARADWRAAQDQVSAVNDQPQG